MDNGFNQMNNTSFQPAPNAVAQQNYAQPQPNYVQPQQSYTQPQAGYVQLQQNYAQPAPSTSENKTAYTSNSVPVNQFTSTQPAGQAKCPGKEIAGMIFGISSLVMGVPALIMGMVTFLSGSVVSVGRNYSLAGTSVTSMTGSAPNYTPIASPIGVLSRRLFSLTTVYGLIFALMAIGFAITTMILRGKVYAQASEVTGKIKAGFGLAIAGIITGGVGLLFNIIGFILMIS